MQMWDVCEMYRDVINKKDYHKATPLTNIPYAIAKFKIGVFELDKKYPKGTYFIPVKNGTKPLDLKRFKNGKSTQNSK